MVSDMFQKSIYGLFYLIIEIFDIRVLKLYEFFLLIKRHKYRNLMDLFGFYCNIIACPPLSN
jgi:hypothetical protein